MRLKRDADILGLIRKTKECRGEVIFQTATDSLRLKSHKIAQYVFVAMANNNSMMRDGEILCQKEEDYEKLRDYLES